MRINRLFKTLLAIGVASSTLLSLNEANASGFQLREQDNAMLGDNYSGSAAEADSASTAWYNPAGLTNLSKAQLSTGVAAVNTSVPYSGTVAVNTLADPGPQPVYANGGGTFYIPNFHISTPLGNRWAFGFSAVVPFGLETDYGSRTNLRYAATKTAVTVYDYSPDLAFQVNKIMSIGAGLDIQYMDGIFNQYAALGDPSYDTRSDNSGSDTAYGYHMGMLFQFTPLTKVGIAYHSQVVHHLSGKSKFKGPLANGTAGGIQTSDDLKANVTLPSYATLSVDQKINAHWTALASAEYTWWDVMKQLHLQNIAAIDTGTGQALNNAEVTIIDNYKNTWNFALGLHYAPTEKWVLKVGTGYDETPSSGNHRNVQLPDQDRVALTTGVHYQVLNSLGLDLGYMHLFIRKARIDNTQAVTSEEVTTVGHVEGFANLYGFQLQWQF